MKTDNNDSDKVDKAPVGAVRPQLHVGVGGMGGDGLTMEEKIARATEAMIDMMYNGLQHPAQWPSRQDVCDVLAKIFMSQSNLDHDREMGEEDKRYTVLEVGSLSEHLELQVLEPARMVMGRSYVLSPGQRAVLREWYGLTPTRTVTLQEVALWEGTRHPKRVIVRSDEHVHSGRKHVLVSATIDNPGEFFTAARVKDQELRDVKPQRGVVVAVPCKGIVMVKVGAGREPVSMVTTLNLSVNGDVVCKYDLEIEKWKVVRCLDPKEVEDGEERKVRKKGPTLHSLSQLLDELEVK